MKWKQFLKPSWKKIIIFIIFSIVFLMFSRRNLLPGGELINEAVGFPLPFKLLYTEAPIAGQYVSLMKLLFAAFFVIDVIFWYLISCLIVWIYDRFKKKA